MNSGYFHANEFEILLIKPFPQTQQGNEFN